MEPTIGRIVLFTCPFTMTTFPAIVVRVWSPTCVNLRVFRDDGQQEVFTSVTHTESPAPCSWRWPERKQ